MVTTSKLEKDRLDKLKELSPKEADEYIESLVLKSFIGFTGENIDVSIDNSDELDRLDEFIDICNKDTSFNNVDAVVLDRKMRYLKVAYQSAFLNFKNFKLKTYDAFNFTMDVTRLEMLLFELKEILVVYYDNYSNYGRMEDLLFDLDDDGLTVNSDIHEKYVYSKKYGFNKSLMDELDIVIGVKVKIILDELDRLDKRYLIDSEFGAAVTGLADGIHETITAIYGNSNDFEINAAKQSGLIDALLESVADFKDSAVRNNDEYLDVKNKILDVIDGNGFAELSAKSYERHKERYGDVDFDKFMEKEPKYDVRNAKFIYPDNREYYEF